MVIKQGRYMTKQTVAVTLLLCLPFFLHAAGSSQKVVVNGGIINSATSGGTARVNIGSTVGLGKVSSVSQSAAVSGVIVNTAAGKGSKSEVNIGSIIK